MIPFRLQIKYFLENPDDVDMSIFIGLFQRWIQKNRLSGLLIDVADYRHVPEGPGVVLIGDESDYALDSAGGRPGLLFTRKRQRDTSLQAQLRVSFQLALTACHLIETDAPGKQKKPLRFRADEVEVRFADRLHFPNQPQTFALVQNDLSGVISEIYGNLPVNLAQVEGDTRQMFTINLRAQGAVSVATLLDQFKVSNPT